MSKFRVIAVEKNYLEMEVETVDVAAAIRYARDPGNAHEWETTASKLEDVVVEEEL